jgi:hypothetical protein
MRLETLDPMHANHTVERIVESRNHQSSGVSSVYSLNLARNISIASQSEQGDQIMMFEKATASAETNASTLV